MTYYILILNCVIVMCRQSFASDDAPNVLSSKIAHQNEDSIPNIIAEDIKTTNDVPAGNVEVPKEMELHAETVTEKDDVKTLQNVSASGNGTKVSHLICNPRNSSEIAEVRLVNNSVLLSIIIPDSNITANECVLVLFYAPWCHFCASAAPHYNALARLFPSIHVLALDAIKYHSLNTRYGTVAVPTLLLFHNGRPITKFNETSYTLDNFVKFVSKYTGLVAAFGVNVTSADFEGPLPSELVRETDLLLWISWIFLILCFSFGFMKSPCCHYILESIRNNWLEAEAQHEHEE